MEYPVADLWNKLTEPNSMEYPVPDLWNKLTEPNSMGYPVPDLCCGISQLSPIPWNSLYIISAVE